MKTAIVKPGTYFLGDPCYAVPDELWMPLLESCEFFEGSSFGTVTKDGKNYEVLGFSTAYGDGCYHGSNGFSYWVDAGLIGLTPVELCTDPGFDVTLGTIVTFTESVECTNDNGYMEFGSIIIDTAGCEDSEFGDSWYDTDGDE